MKLLSAAGLLLLAPAALIAQSSSSASQPVKKIVDPVPPTAAFTLVSPEVHSDKTVTFRYFAPKAEKVMVALEGVADPYPMAKDEHGVWSYTTQPLSPEWYGYNIIVDGTFQIDPHAVAIRPNLLAPTATVHVPGVPASPWDRTDIPHGAVQHLLYRSKLANDDRDMWVYTPPNYDPNRKEKYPVLYLLHGYSDNAEGWVAAGQANLILDSLLAEGKIKPMVVVMPLAYGTMEMITKGWTVWKVAPQLPLENQTKFEQQLLHEVLPMAEARFHIATDASHRAIAGLSMGGGHTLYSGLNHPDVFGYVGAMSSAILNKDFDTFYAGRKKARLKLLWISCGTEDGLITDNRAIEAWAKKNVQADSVSTNETPGMHTWLVWRQNLITLAPLLFTK